MNTVTLIKGDDMTDNEIKAIQKRIHELVNENAHCWQVNKILRREIKCTACFAAKRTVPPGTEMIECYETQDEIIIIGEPVDDDHNCDALGCSSVSHVLYRINKSNGKVTPCPD